MSDSRACFFGVLTLGFLLVCAPLLTVSTRIFSTIQVFFLQTSYSLSFVVVPWWCPVLCARIGGCWVGSRRGGVARPHGQAGRQRAPAVLRQVLPPLCLRPLGSGPKATLPPCPPPHRPQQSRLRVPPGLPPTQTHTRARARNTLHPPPPPPPPHQPTLLTFDERVGTPATLRIHPLHTARARAHARAGCCARPSEL